MKIILTPVLVAVAVLAIGCGDGDDADAGDGDRVEVVAAFYPLAEAARRVGGDRVVVIDLTPPGAEPHDLELTADQVDAITDAAVVVLMGRGFQPGVEDVADDRDGATVAVLEDLEATRDLEGEVEEDDHGLDPHVWLDPTQQAKVVELIADALAAADPDGADEYESNAAVYIEALDRLDADIEAGLAGCERTDIITAHEAFGWLAARYGLREEAIAGISPDQEPDARRLGELADLVEERGITTVFTEDLVSPAVAAALAREAGVETAVLNPLEGLTDEQADAGEDYVSVMRSNLATLQDALGC